MDTRNPSYTKKGPGRKHRGVSHLLKDVPTVEVYEGKQTGRRNVGKAPVGGVRRVWRQGEPVHIQRPVRAELRRIAALAKETTA